MAEDATVVDAPAPAVQEQNAAVPVSIDAAAAGEHIVDASNPKKRAQPQDQENEDRGATKRVKGVAPIKAEFAIPSMNSNMTIN